MIKPNTYRFFAFGLVWRSIITVLLVGFVLAKPVQSMAAVFSGESVEWCSDDSNNESQEEEDSQQEESENDSEEEFEEGRLINEITRDPIKLLLLNSKTVHLNSLNRNSSDIYLAVKVPPPE